MRPTTVSTGKAGCNKVARQHVEQMEREESEDDSPRQQAGREKQQRLE